MRWLVLLLALSLAACTTKMGKDGRTQTTVDVKYLAKSDVDRIADTDRAEVVEGLLLIADKLYKRNPKEWKKGGAVSREAAVERLRQRNSRSWPEFGGLRERQAAALAFSNAYDGDRVAALVYGLLTMVDAAFEHKEEFYILDSLNETKLYNAARNMEIAVWKLGNDRNQAGELFLLSNELDPANRNLSFEREFGRITGLLDLMAKIVADRNGRTVSRSAQAVATMVFLPVGF
jgi:Ni/Co efflux regulator RcnB